MVIWRDVYKLTYTPIVRPAKDINTRLPIQLQKDNNDNLKWQSLDQISKQINMTILVVR
jgi:hypothetical protein